MPRLLLRSLPGHAPRRGVPDGRRPADRVRPAARACPGGSPSRPSAPSIVDGDYQYQSFGVPGPGPEAGPRAGPGRRPLRHGPGRDGRAPRGPGELPPARRRGGRGALRLLRGHRLHARTAAQGQALGRRPVVHGPPPGDEPGRAGQRAARRADAPPVPRRADGPGGRAAAPGAGPARRRRSSSRPRPTSRPARRPDRQRPTVPLDEPAADARRPRPRPRTHLLSNGSIT